MSEFLNSFSYAENNVGPTEYVTLIESTPLSVSKFQVTDTSGQLLKIAKGAVGEEISFCTTPGNGSVIIPCFLQAGERLSIKAINNVTVNSGFNIIAFLNI